LITYLLYHSFFSFQVRDGRGGATGNGGVTFHPSVEEREDGARSGFALVVNGHSLVYALAEELELLFLGVAEQCNGKR